MRFLRPVFLFFCLAGTPWALSEMPLFLMDYQVYQVGFSNDFRLYDYNNDNKAMRLPDRSMEMRMALTGAAKLKFRYLSLCLKSDLRTRLLQAEKKRDWSAGPGDVEILAFKSINGRCLAGARAAFPTASYRKGLGPGCNQYEGYLAFRYDFAWTGEAHVTWSTRNPDRLRPGLETCIGMGWEDYFSAGIFLFFRLPDQTLAGQAADRTSYTARVTFGLLDDQFGAVKAFFNLFSDVYGADAPLRSGLSISVAF